MFISCRLQIYISIFDTAIAKSLLFQHKETVYLHEKKRIKYNTGNKNKRS